jgi:glutathione S-transferase
MAFTGPVFWHVVRIPKAERGPVAVAAALEQLHATLATAERQVEGNGWLAGANFTLADVQFGYVLYRYFDIEIERPAWPALRRYFDRLMDRSAYREHVGIPYDELPGSPPASS